MANSGSVFVFARPPTPSRSGKPNLTHNPILLPLLAEKVQPFDEGAAQVARLLARDKRELLGDGADVADFVAASEFAQDAEAGPSIAQDAEAGPSTTTATAAAAAAAAAAPLPSPASPFGSPPPASPFSGIGFGTGAGAGNPMGALGAGTDGTPLFTEAEDFASSAAGGGGGGGGPGGGPAPWYAGITLAQVLIALSFVLVIVLMLATFAFVFKVGAIHFNE